MTDNNFTSSKLLHVLKPDFLTCAAAITSAIEAIHTVPEGLSLIWQAATVATTAVAVGYGAKLGKVAGGRAAKFLRIIALTASASPQTRTGPLSPVQERFILNQLNSNLDRLNSDPTIQKQIKTTVFAIAAGAIVGYIAGGAITYNLVNPTVDRFAASYLQTPELK